MNSEQKADPTGRLFVFLPASPVVGWVKPFSADPPKPVNRRRDAQDPPYIGFQPTRIKTVGTCEGVVVLFIFRGFAALQPRPHTLGCGPDVPSFSASAPAIPSHRWRPLPLWVST